MATTATPAPAESAAAVDAVRLLEAGVDALAGVDVDMLGEAGVGQALGGAERAIRRLQALQARWANTLSRRRAAAARTQRPDDPRAAQKAARAVRGELTDQLGITPSQSKRLVRTGAQLEHLPITSDACRQGRLTSAHVRVIDEVTAHFNGDQRARFEEELTALAERCRDAVEFGREARRRLIERDHDAAMADLDRRKARRSARVAQDPDGTTHLRLDTAGYAGTASTQHGVRPHVTLVVRAESVRPRTGAARTNWTGPLPYAEVARLLGDCSLARIVADAEDAPLSVSRQVRTVPMGLWRLLVLRDGGCIVQGCDAPPGWCQVAHLDDGYAAGGKLSPGTAGLLCTAGSNHHAMFDHGDHTASWVDGRPVVRFGERRPLDHGPAPARMASESPATYAATPSGSVTVRAGPGSSTRPTANGNNTARARARPPVVRSRARSPARSAVAPAP